jgi:hypothetical protein
MVLPVLKTGGKALLREGALTGMQVAQDALKGRNVKESLKEHASEAGQRLLRGAVSYVGNTTGSSIKRNASQQPRHSLPKKKKKQASDIFG